MPRRHRTQADFDSPWKETLERFLEAFLALFFPAVHAGIDWSRGYQSLDKELHQILRGAEGHEALADKLFKVWRPDGKETWLLIHIEIQGQPEEAFPERMFRYNFRAFDRYNRMVVSLALLTDERANWRPHEFGYGDWGAWTGTRFLAVKLLDWLGREAELQASSNPIAPVVLAHQAATATRRDPQDRCRYKIDLVKSLYREGFSAEDVRQLFRIIDWLLELPRELQDGFQEELYAWEEEKHMQYITSVERHGMEKGRREGLEEGERKGLHTAIADALATRFGASGKRLMVRVRAVESADQLRALLKRVWTAETLDEVRAHLPQRSS